MKRRLALAAGAAVMLIGATAGLAGPAIALPAPARALPTNIALPDGFGPESIVAGPDGYAYTGSRFYGSIYQINLQTGKGRIISPATGTPSWGVKTDGRGRLFVAGGTNGDARVISIGTGKVLASYQLSAADDIINDVLVTPHAVYFTDSTSPILYKLPLGPDGVLPSASQIVRVKLTGDIRYVSNAYNANGITLTPDGCGIIIVQSVTGFLFRVDPATGVTRKINIGAESVPHADGLLLVGHTLYAIQNVLNELAVVHLNDQGTAGTLVERVTNAAFDTPSSVTIYDGLLYLDNARFFANETPTTPYNVVAIPIPVP